MARTLAAGQVRPRQGTEICNFGAPSPLWGGSPLDFFAFSPVFMCNLVRRAPWNVEKVAKNPVEKIASNPVTSVAVMVFSALMSLVGWPLLRMAASPSFGAPPPIDLIIYPDWRSSQLMREALVLFQDHSSTPNPQVCWFYFWNLGQKENPY